ncbi:MAG: MmcQ/YjbR family DNA-binding protein [Ignavibacteriales bacterium]|nr:MmcQ/YjbR family DNA-binding protein [Ignavibacteriales bacterium]
MEIEDLRKHCLAKIGANESLPFGEDTLVFKVAEKMFCLLSLVPPFAISLKAEPIKVIELREEFEEIKPGYHMNKKHWITVDLEGSLPKKFIFNLVDESYDLVYKKLTKKQKSEVDKNR